MKKLLKGALIVVIAFLAIGFGMTGDFSFLRDTEPAEPEARMTDARAEFGECLAVFPEESLLWGYHQLTPEEQDMYLLLRDAVGAYYEEKLPCSISLTELERVLEALAGDHPELFWFNGGIQYYYPSDGSQEYPETVVLTYIMDKDMIPGYQDVVRRYTETCMLDEKVASAQTDFDKIVAVYHYITDNTIYVEEKDDQSLITLMTEGKAVCAGYSDSFQLLMHHMGLPCYSVSGHGFLEDGTVPELGHSWNTVQCDGVWYNVDATWDDPVVGDGNGGTMELEGPNHRYLLVNDELFYRDHLDTTFLGAPNCDSMEQNYHNHYYLLYSTWDEATFRWAVETQQSYGMEWAEVRYDNYEAYYSAKAALEDGGLFGQIVLDLGLGTENSDGTFSYTYNCNDDTGVITLKLIY